MQILNVLTFQWIVYKINEGVFIYTNKTKFNKDFKQFITYVNDNIDYIVIYGTQNVLFIESIFVKSIRCRLHNNDFEININDNKGLPLYSLNKVNKKQKEELKSLIKFLQDRLLVIQDKGFSVVFTKVGKSEGGYISSWIECKLFLKKTLIHQSQAVREKFHLCEFFHKRPVDFFSHEIFMQKLFYEKIKESDLRDFLQKEFFKLSNNVLENEYISKDSFRFDEL